MTSQLTPIGLIDALVEEINKIFDGYLYKIPHDPENVTTLDDYSEDGTVSGQGTETEAASHDKESDYVKRRPLRVFAQDVPINETGDDFDPVPYVIVRLKSGDDDGSADAVNTVQVIFIIAIWDDDNDSQGFRDVMDIIQKIYIRFHKEPMLNNQFMYAGQFHWALQEDNYWPYFFGACNMNFNIPSIRRENEFA